MYSLRDQSGSQSLNSSNNTFYTDYYTTSFSEQQVVEEEFMIGRAKQVLTTFLTTYDCLC